MRHLILALSLLIGSASRADAQVAVHVGVGVALPGVQIGINLPAYPRLVVIPGTPVYYAPAAALNYFFYDGAYWVYRGASWYVSSWYGGPWYLVDPYDVPVYLLRVPVRYYRDPPPHFRGWLRDRPPRWSEHWGREWAARRPGWDRWDRRHAPRPAPLPTYQRRYGGERYPQDVARQHEIRSARYRYHPHEPVTRQHYGDPRMRGAPEGRGPDDRPAPGHQGRGNGRGQSDERGSGDR